MRIALAQTNIIWEDKQANLVRAEEFVIAADAEVVLFPEMSLTGFSMHTDVTAEICQPDAEIQSRAQTDSTPDMTNQPTTGWTIEQIKTLADRHHTTIGIGWVKKTEPLCENHYSIVTPDGKIVMDYAKIHPFSYGEEHAHFRGGEKICTGKLGEFQAGLAICYDLPLPGTVPGDGAGDGDFYCGCKLAGGTYVALEDITCCTCNRESVLCSRCELLRRYGRTVLFWGFGRVCPGW